MHEGGKRAIAAALAANFAIAVAKLIGFAVTGAASMLAESVHSLADTGNQGLLLLGGRLSRREPTESHPFGYGRERYFWAFVVSMVLFTLGSVAALYEGIEKLLHPHELDNVWWAAGILVFALVAESVSFRTAYKESKPLKGDLTWPEFIHRTKSPELSVVLLEDTGALLGLLFALSGVVAAAVTGNGRFDAAGSIAIGVLLGIIACVLARENKSLLIGEAADPVVLERVRNAISQHRSVRRLIHLRTMHLGPDELLVAAKLEFDPSLSREDVPKAIDSVEEEIRGSEPAARMIFLEPDSYREPHSL